MLREKARAMAGQARDVLEPAKVRRTLRLAIAKKSKEGRAAV